MASIKKMFDHIVAHITAAKESHILEGRSSESLSDGLYH